MTADLIKTKTISVTGAIIRLDYHIVWAGIRNLMNTMNCCKKILTFVLLLWMYGAKAQNIERFNTFSYSVNDGLLQSTISQLAFDRNNFCWISFPNGIQKFDGKNFTNVPVQPGLPDDKFVYFFTCTNGNLLLSHDQGISIYGIRNNKFTQVYNKPANVKKHLVFIGEDEGIIYLYADNGNITGISNKDYKEISTMVSGLPNANTGSDYMPRISSNIINHRIALLIKSRLFLWDLQKGKLLGASDSIPEVSPFFLTLKTGNEVYYNKYTVNDALCMYDFTKNRHTTQPVKGKGDDYISRCIIYPWQGRQLVSFANRLYEADLELLELKSELVNFQNKPMVSRNTGVANIYQDNFGNLYLQTVTDGIKKIIRNNYPVKYYGSEIKEENNVLSILPDKIKNRILVGAANNGVRIFDTLQHLVKHIKNLPGSNTPFSPNNIIKDKNGSYLLFNTGETNLWRISSDLSAITRVPIQFREKNAIIHYFGNFISRNEEEAVVQAQGVLLRTTFSTGKVDAYEFTKSYAMGGLRYNDFIISHANDELIFIDALNFALIKKIPFTNTGYVRSFAMDAAKNIYIGSNKGIFKIDDTGKILLHLTKENGLPDECIYAMSFDDQGFLWCSTNKGIFKLNKDNSIFQLTKEDGLQENEFNTNVVAKAADGEVFFGGVNGVSSFYPAAISSFKEEIQLLFTKIKINNEEAFKDTATWNINKIDLPYDQNSLSFDFIAMANNNPGQYIYQYRMEGIDQEWVQNNDLQTVRYFLPPGHYVFKVYASRFFDKHAKPLKEIEIIIRPPFWKTWWFITGFILLLFAGLAYAFNRYNKRKYQKKLAILENEHKIQLERERISRDLHDSIGAYANAVLYNTELLQKENDAMEKNVLMNDLKFASKDIITSLRETVWALKKGNYTAEECLLRIKNFIQALSRYYPHIQFKAEGEASAGKILHHTKALHVVRIVQEAVTNAIKHAAANNISLSSSEQNGKWELRVTDDGKGFDYEAMKRAEHGNGLLNMNQRAAESGIEFKVSSTPGSGTTITMLV